MNKEVSFKLAMLLKENGFDMPCNDYYTSRGLLNSDGWGDIIYEDGGFSSGEPERMIRFDYSDFSKRQKEEYYLCPTISEVVMWLYEKHGIWIYIMQSTARLSFRFFIQRLKILGEGDILNDEKYNSPIEAHEAAIEYTLNNLI